MAAAVLVLCLLFGGWDRPAGQSDAFLQLAAVPLLLLALWTLRGTSQPLGYALVFCLVVVLVPLVQLVPLPAHIWTQLPLRDLAEQALVLAGQDPGWRPVSLTPHATWLSLLSLIPPMAVFLATLCLSNGERRALMLLLLGIGVLSCFLGLLQVAQGPNGWLQGLGLASSGDAEGFFVNRNLFAASLYSFLLFAGAFAIHSTATFATQQTADTRTLVAMLASFTVLVALLAALMMARSRAGLGLSIVALFGIAAMASSDERGRSALAAKRLVGGAVVLVLLFASQFALYRVMERFAQDPLADARTTLARNTWEAAWALLPFGSGAGSFVPVYQFFEKPTDALVDTYVNRAHNDFLEVALETGLAGIALMALFVAWFALRFWQVWRSDNLGGSPLDSLLVRAATLVIVLLMAHSVVDYPLRTTAMMAVFAFACGLLFEPVPGTGDRPARAGDQARDVDRLGTSRQTAAYDAAGRSVRQSDRDVDLGWPTREDLGSVTPAPRTGPASPQAPLQSQRPSGAAAHEAWAWPEATGTPQPAPSQVPRSPPPGGSTSPAPLKGGVWGSEIDWPDAWRPSSKPQDKPSGETAPSKPTDREPDDE